MSANQPSNLPASVRQRLLNIAKRDGEAFDLVLTRYALAGRGKAIRNKSKHQSQHHRLTTLSREPF